jgi:hypothetical protein
MISVVGWTIRRSLLEISSQSAGRLASDESSRLTGFYTETRGIVTVAGGLLKSLSAVATVILSWTITSAPVILGHRLDII